MVRQGFIFCDFATNRTEYRVYKLPGSPPAFVLSDPTPEPTPGIAPSPAAVRALIARKYPGFPFVAKLP
jgi:hypothetical protein